MAFKVLKWLVESLQPSFNILWRQLLVLINQANRLIGRPLHEIQMCTNFCFSCIVIFKSPRVGLQFHSCPAKSDPPEMTQTMVVVLTTSYWRPSKRLGNLWISCSHRTSARAVLWRSIISPLIHSSDGNAAAAVTFSVKSGRGRSWWANSVNPPTRCRLTYTLHRKKKMFLSNLTQFFDDSALTLAAAAPLHAFMERILIEQQSQPRGFSGDVAQCLIGYVPSLPRSLSSQSTKDVKGLNHWCCSSAAALWNMAEGFEGRASPFKRILKSEIQRCISAHRSFKYMARSPAHDMHCTSRGALLNPHFF